MIQIDPSRLWAYPFGKEHSCYLNTTLATNLDLNRNCDHGYKFDCSSPDRLGELNCNL